jgi:hypothetical protein
MITASMTLLVLGDKCPKLNERKLRKRIVMGGQERTTTLTPSLWLRRKGLRRGPEGLVGSGRIVDIRQIF